jgi:hypothetical protein
MLHSSAGWLACVITKRYEANHIKNRRPHFTRRITPPSSIEINAGPQTEGDLPVFPFFVGL